MRAIFVATLLACAACASSTPPARTPACEELLRCNAAQCRCPDGYACRRLASPPDAECVPASHAPERL